MRYLLKPLNQLEALFDNLKARTLRRLDPARIKIMPFISYGNHDVVVLRGRVLRATVDEPNQDDSAWRNFLNTVRRFNSKEVPHATLKAMLGGYEHVLTTDEDGFFHEVLPLASFTLGEKIIQPIQFMLLDYPYRTQPIPETTVEGQVIILRANAQFGVISDLDDTVLRTDVVSVLRMMRNTFLRNVHTRVPFDGVAAFYRALQAGTQPNGYNPLYYVSNSPWNLYDFLLDFFELRHVPIGPFFLRNLGLTDKEFFVRPGKKHKASQIEHIFETFPDLSFILIGDSGEHDAEIYARAVEKYPNRVLAIYIRDVTTYFGKANQVQALAKRVKALGVEMLLVKDTVAAAQHAIEQGYIAAEALTNIRSERDRDEKADTPLDELIKRPPNG